MKKLKTEKPPQVLAKHYEPTPQEHKAIAAYLGENDEKAPRPRAIVTTTAGQTSISLDHPESAIAKVLLARTMGTTDSEFNSGLLLQLASASAEGSKPNEGALNFMLSVIDGIKPRDHVEAMLAAQMAAIHAAIMTFARRLAHVNQLAQ